jgi:hypothetical protein
MPAASKKRAKKPVSDDDDSDTDTDSNNNVEAPVARTSYLRATRATPLRAAATKNAVIDASDDDDASESDFDSASDAEDDENFEAVKIRHSTASTKSSKAAPKKKAQKKTDARGNSADKSGNNVAPLKLTAKKGAGKAAHIRAAPKKKLNKDFANGDDSNSDTEKDSIPVAKTKVSKAALSASKKKTKKGETNNDDSDVDDMDLEKSTAKSSNSKAIPKTIKKKQKEESSDSGNSDSNDESSIEVPKSMAKKRVLKSTPKASYKKRKKDLSDEDEADSGSDVDAQDSKVIGKKKVFKKGTCESVLRKHEYQLHRDDWLSRPITKYAAAYSLPSPMGRKDLSSALLSGLWGGKSLTISKWIAAQSEVHLECGGLVLSAPEAALDVKIVKDGGSQSVFLRPYEGVVVNTSNAQGSRSEHCAEMDIYLNTAGPIWCIAFAPARKDISPPPMLFERHLAVGTSRIGWLDANSLRTLAGTCEVGDDIPYTLGAKYTTPNLLQIWKIQSSTLDSDSIAETTVEINKTKKNFPISNSETKATLEYCVGLPFRGPVWKAVWSSWTPFRALNGDFDGGNESAESDRETYEKSLNFLGLIAVVCGDGSCLVLVLPRTATPNLTASTSSNPPASSSSSSSSSSSGNMNRTPFSTSSSSSSVPVDRVPVITEVSVCRWVVTVPRACVGSKYSGVPLSPLKCL